MKKNVLNSLMLLLLFSYTEIKAQVYEGNLSFSSQYDIDLFSQPPYDLFTSVNGNLTISMEPLLILSILTD